MQQLRLLRLEQPTGRGPECPPEELWMEIVAGISDQESGPQLEHAAICDHCGPLLRIASDTLASGSTREEEAFLEGLASERPDWKQKMARTLYDTAAENSAKKEPFGWLRDIFSPLRLLVATSVIVLIALGVWFGMRYVRRPSVDQLLAEAYSDPRTLDVRIPGARYSPIRSERGTRKSNAEKPLSLKEAELLIAENLQSNPTDAHWLDEQGRADMLGGDYDHAVQELKQGLVYEPDSFLLLEDLGAAYYMRGQSDDAATDYGNAIEELSKALVKEPHNPVALFNIALACEKFYLNVCATNTWEDYLKIDSSGEWSNEARKHLNQDSQKREPHASSTLPSLLGPKEFSEAIAASPSESQSEFGARAERYQDVALKSWLPYALQKGLASQSSSGSLHGVQSLGRLLRESRDDSWLEDLLQKPLTPGLESGIRDTLESDTAVLAGKYGMALDLARSAATHFEVAHNMSGLYWAKLAEMEAQSSALNFSDCLRDENSLFPQLAESDYHWLQAATLIEQAECQAGLARLKDAISNNKKGRELAKRFHYPTLALKGIAFGSKYLLSIGYEEEGLHELRSGLAEFWASDVADAPGENLYACLST